jgi:hypothetical protein
MNFTHDTKYSDIPLEAFIRATSLEDGMVVLFKECGVNGVEYGVVMFENSGRCRDVHKHADFQKVLDWYMDAVKIDIINEEINYGT